jgi:hypothetical protein
MDFAVLRSSLELELIVGCLTSSDNFFYTYAGREQVFKFMVFNASFNNISVISWRSDLLVEETRVPRETTMLLCAI